MKHFLCDGGCGGESDLPGVCQDSECSDNQLPLNVCECEDGEHGMDIEFEFEMDFDEE